MYATSTRQDNLFTFDPALRLPLIISVIFHILVIVGFTIGLPYVRQPIVMNTPVSVELVPIDQITQTNKLMAPKKVDEAKPEQAPPETKVKPPEMKEEKPPEPTPPKPPEPEKIEQKTPEPKPPEPKKEEVKKPEPKKEPPKEKTKEEPKQDEDFQSLLKNLAPATPDATDVAEAKEETTPTPSAIATLSDRLTMSQEDALRRQLGQCWNVPAGAKMAEELVVEIRVTLNQDKTVQQAIILDQGRYNRDTVFRAAADAAVRAFQNPHCIPLELPDGGYDQWKTMTVRFDPKDML